MDALTGHAEPAEWRPVRIGTFAAEPAVEWALLETPYLEPFFEQTADRAMRRPFNRVFARRAPLAELATAELGTAADRAPAGVIFHMSRCGSTLIAQMLSRVTGALVLSEPQPLDAVLRLHAAGRLDETTAVRLLRRLVAALGPRESEQRVFLKTHAWHVRELSLLRRAFPETPWSFVFREPGAVLRSHARTAGAETSRETSDPRTLGLTREEAAAMTSEAYTGAALAAFCDAALAHAGDGRAAFVDYAELPDGVFTKLLPFYAVRAGAADVARMRAIAAFDTKAPPGSGSAPSAFAEGDRTAAPVASARLEALYERLRACAAAAR